MLQHLVNEDRRRNAKGCIVARDRARAPRCNSRHVGSEALQCARWNDKSWLLRKARVAVKDDGLTGAGSHDPAWSACRTRRATPVRISVIIYPIAVAATTDCATDCHR